jgi:hypothetical protein
MRASAQSGAGEVLDEVAELRGWLAIAGYPHELRVGQSFGRAGWDISHAEYFFDDAEERFREIDLLARMIPPRPTTDDERLQAGPRNQGRIPSSAGAAVTVSVALVIECKKSQKPWVVFTSPSSTKKLFYPTHFTPYGPGRFAIYRTLTAYSEDAFENEDDPPRELFDDNFLYRLPLFSVGPQVGHGIAMDQGKERGKSQAYEAVESAVRAATYYSRQNANAVLDRSTREDITIYLPIVILQGSLYECSVDVGGGEILRKVEQSMLLARDARSDADPVVVRILTTPKLDDFAAELGAASLEIANRVSRPEDEFWIWAAEEFIEDYNKRRLPRPSIEKREPPPDRTDSKG